MHLGKKRRNEAMECESLKGKKPKRPDKTERCVVDAREDE